MDITAIQLVYLHVKLYNATIYRELCNCYETANDNSLSEPNREYLDKII